MRRIGRGFGYGKEIALGSRCSTVSLICDGARGAFSHERLSLKDPEIPEGDLVYRFKTPWCDGTEGVVLSATELLEKLVALVPPKNAHLTR